VNSHVSSCRFPMALQALSLLLPTDDQTLLLRACLWEGEAGRRAWRTWVARAGNARDALVDDREAMQGLVPLLFCSVQRNGAEIRKNLLPHLRAVFLHEERRTEIYRSVCHSILNLLARTGVSLIVLKGVALADQVYNDWTLRHCHDMDILVPPDEQIRTVNALKSSGAILCGPAGARRRTTVLEDESGLRINVHTDLFRIPYYRPPMKKMWERSLVREILGVTIRVLALPDMLVHVCGHASCSPSQTSLRWVCDAWHITLRLESPAWELLLDTALRSRLELPLHAVLTYLFDELRAPIPSSVLEGLFTAARRSPPLAKEAALLGVRMGAPRSPWTVFTHAGSWRERAFVLRWIALPSPACLRWSRGRGSTRNLLVHYVRRPLRRFMRRMREVSKAALQ